MSIYSIFFELIQIATGNREACLSRTLSDEEWEQLYKIARNQTLTGVCFYAVKQLPKEQQPSRRCIHQWVAMAIRLEGSNKRVFEECRYATKRFSDDGFCSCILKGQSLLKYYPEPLRLLRVPGDVDVWMRPYTCLRESFPEHKKSWVERFLLLDDFYLTGKYIKTISKTMDDVVYHHFHCDILPTNMVEVHVTPAFFMNPFKNKRLQRLFDKHWKSVENQNSKASEEGFYSMPLDLNVVFLISHFYRHLILEGVGMRQLMDIYCVVKCYIDTAKIESKETCGMSCQLVRPAELMKDVKRLGMYRITRAIMWVLTNCFGMKNEYLLCPPSEKYGRHLLEEMLKGGNFGHSSKEAGMMYSGETSAIRFWRSCKYGMRLLTYYPGEALWVPFNNAKQSIIKNYFRRHPL